MNLLDCVHGFRLEFESAPLYSNRYNRAYLLGSEGSDDYIGAICRVLGLYFNVKGRLGADVNLRDELGGTVFFLLLQKPTKQTHLPY